MKIFIYANTAKKTKWWQDNQPTDTKYYSMRDLKIVKKYSVRPWLWRKSSFPFGFLPVNHFTLSKFHVTITLNERYFCCETDPCTDRPFLNVLPFYIQSATPHDPVSFPRPLLVKRKNKYAESWLIRINSFNLTSKILNAEKVTVSCRWW